METLKRYDCDAFESEYGNILNHTERKQYSEFINGNPEPYVEVTQTGIGQKFIVKSDKSKKQLDFTDYDLW